MSAVVDAPPLAEKRPLMMVDEALERKPLANVARPVCVVAPFTVSEPRLAVCANRFVDDAVVEKRLVEVAFASVVSPFRYAAPETVRAVEEAKVTTPFVEKRWVAVSAVLLA